MIAWMLGRFNRGLCDLDLVARVLAANTLRAHVPYVAALNEATVKRELRYRYVQVANETGLPAAAADRVADLAWRHIAQAQERQPPSQERVRLYV